MARRNRLRFVKRTIYRLKRSYGVPLDLYTQTLGDTDTRTGEKTISYTKAHIRKAIVQPARTHREFVYDLAYISANKDFTTGGFFDASDRRVILDRSDLPADWVMNNDQFVIFDNRRFDVKSYYEFETNTGYILVLRESVGQKIVRLEEGTSILTLQDSAAGVI